ncbi:MAG: hypothetical protein ACI8QS_001737 [Planctomycetota bacterium]|jgi:hypothetical protein
MNSLSNQPPHLVLTIDVEEDMPDWKITPETTTRNVEALVEFADSMAEMGLRPTYLCNYPVVTQSRSADVLREVIEIAACEFGSHMHAWNTPPHNNKREQGLAWRGDPYYESELELETFRAKLLSLHQAVSDVAGRAPTSYRAGRFGVEGKALLEIAAQGYRVDSSVIPLSEHVLDGGPDHRGAPQGPYFPSDENVARPGKLPILEVPISIGLTRRLPEFLRRAFVHTPRWTRLRGLLSSDFLGWIDYGWLYPARFDTKTMCGVASTLVGSGIPVLNVFLHSSELVAGASGRIKTSADVNNLRAQLDAVLKHCITNLGAVPTTLTEFADLANPAGSPPSGAEPRPDGKA